MSSAPSWHLDETDPGQFRYWDGEAWTDQRRPALVYLAQEQLALTRVMANDLRVTKGWVTFMGVLVLIGLVLAFLAAAGVLNRLT